MQSKTVVCLSLLSAFFMIGKVSPFSIGEPLDVFFGVLFYFIIGWSSIGFVFLLTSVDVVLGLPSILAIGVEVQRATFALSGDASTASLLVSVVPEWMFSAILVGCLYFGVAFGMVNCYWVIKRLRLVERLLGVHV